eukprot:CAMPEP_0185586514 /NCGR_PEP_ID=MMETSP0434-20130131/44717_1 /TAXON_ID=626734 ORGANISM="Favella taraikaensis, Strain Fe Narragansett Bay" /NCGR_SAMPLE_ID=MMETSP0434 /ASSEMBLY_ACC=CAM_ASM_000379 /LENGTH=62 /DNA_ID=CAMNT_0028207693 /DNA_START=618 /DNA_END=806 /DNA_ORIENTATION=+
MLEELENRLKLTFKENQNRMSFVHEIATEGGRLLTDEDTPEPPLISTREQDRNQKIMERDFS